MDHLHMPTIVVHWCGHGQEVLPIPAKDGICDLVPVIISGAFPKRVSREEASEDP